MWENTFKKTYLPTLFFLNLLQKPQHFFFGLRDIPSPQPPAHLPHSHCVHRNWCGRWLEERLQRAVNWTQHRLSLSKRSWKSCFHSSQGCATPLSRKVVCRRPRQLPLWHQHWRNPVWIQAIWRINARFRTSLSCWRLWRESLFVNHRSTANSLLPKFQSGFRRHHSTESALLRVLSDIFSATDKGEVSLLALLDVNAAFDTVDHSILLDRLSISYGISGSAFDWMQSFIVSRTQTVHYGGSVSRRAQLRSGIAQGSVLGPILYVLYTADVQKLVESFGFRVHLYADDTQFHDSCKSTDAAELASRAMHVIEAVREWSSSNRLRLYTDKTQFIWLGTSHFLDVLQVNSIPANEAFNNRWVFSCLLKVHVSVCSSRANGKSFQAFGPA